MLNLLKGFNYFIDFLLFYYHVYKEINRSNSIQRFFISDIRFKAAALISSEKLF